ncbi:MAG: DUF4190 domain-containing protein [Actinomycetes bacterium]
MTVPPNDGVGAAPPPPGIPAGPPPPGMPAYGQPFGAKKSSMPVVALVFGILGFIQCIPLIGGVIAIITGVMGRKRARAAGQSPTMATVGLVLGILGLIISVILTIVFIASGFAIFKIGETVSSQVTIATQLQKASIAAQGYAVTNGGSYEGISLAKLQEFGYTPVADVTVAPYSEAAGTSYCIEGSQSGSGNNLIHMPIQPSDNSQLNLDLNSKAFTYALGGCPK